MRHLTINTGAENTFIPTTDNHKEELLSSALGRALQGAGTDIPARSARLQSLNLVGNGD